MTGRVLLTGGTGFLGVHVGRALRAAGFDVTLAGRTRLSGFEFVEADGLEARAGCAAIASGGYDAVVHLAALARTGEAEAAAGRARATRLNSAWPGELAAAAARAGVRFVHASTDLVFGATAAGPDGFTVDAEVGPVGHYGASKAAGEAAVVRSMPDALVVRFPLMFGDSFGRGLGASDALFAALDRGERPGLFTDELRTPVDVEAAARALVVLLGAGATGVWHLGGRAVSRFELGAALCLKTGRDPAHLVATTRVAAGLEDARAADARLDSRLSIQQNSAIAALLESGKAPPFPKS